MTAEILEIANPKHHTKHSDYRYLFPQACPFLTAQFSSEICMPFSTFCRIMMLTLELRWPHRSFLSFSHFRFFRAKTVLGLRGMIDHAFSHTGRSALLRKSFHCHFESKVTQSTSPGEDSLILFAINLQIHRPNICCLGNIFTSTCWLSVVKGRAGMARSVPNLSLPNTVMLVPCWWQPINHLRLKISEFHAGDMTRKARKITEYTIPVLTMLTIREEQNFQDDLPLESPD